MTRSIVPLGIAGALLLAGCYHTPVSSVQFDEWVQQSPERHMGQIIAGGGMVSAIVQRGDGFTRFRVTSRGIPFEIYYPHALPDLIRRGRIYFLGRVAGGTESRTAEGEIVRVVAVRAIEVDIDTVHHAVVDQNELTSAWHQDRLNVH